MSEHSERPSAMEQPRPPGGSRRRFLAGALTGGIIGSLLAGSVSVYSHVQRGGWRAHAGHGGWFGHHRAHDPDVFGDRLGFATDWVLSRINASDEQQQQVKTILQSALNDLAPLREQHQAHRQAMLDALQQPAIDRTALEELRRNALQLAETASGRFVTAIADVAEVLTPEQRTELAALVTRLHH